MLLYDGCTLNSIGWELHNNFAAYYLRICLCCFLVVLQLRLKEIFKQEFPLSKQEETADSTVFVSHLIKIAVAAETEESFKKYV